MTMRYDDWPASPCPIGNAPKNAVAMWHNPELRKLQGVVGGGR